MTNCFLDSIVVNIPVSNIIHVNKNKTVPTQPMIMRCIPRQCSTSCFSNVARCVRVYQFQCLSDVVANVRCRVGPGAEFIINMFDQRQEFGYNFGATILYFTAFIVQFSVWGPSLSSLRSSNIAAAVPSYLFNDKNNKQYLII